MAPPHGMQLTGRADWTLMTAIHDALRRDLDQLMGTTDSHAPAWLRWSTFRSQLHFHLTAEQTTMWPRARERLIGDRHGQALLDAMDDEHQLLGPLSAVIDDAFTMRADPGRLHQLLARLRTRLASHLAHEEADALPLIGQILSPGELGGIDAAICGGHSIRRARATIPWVLDGARPDVREHVLRQLPAPARILYRRVWLPRYSRTTPAV
jgi:hypothetical protein